MYKLINQWEPIVYDYLQEYIKSMGVECSCERCQADMMAIILNKLPPRYAVSLRGEVLTSTESCTAPIKTQILIEIINAAKLVGASPSHTA
jgi:competence protein ComFB